MGMTHLEAEDKRLSTGRRQTFTEFFILPISSWIQFRFVTVPWYVTVPHFPSIYRLFLRCDAVLYSVHKTWTYAQFFSALTYGPIPFLAMNKASLFFFTASILSPVPVAMRSKAWVCSSSSAEIVGSNPAGGRDVCLLSVLWVVR